jgi:hypothetical protein
MAFDEDRSTGGDEIRFEGGNGDSIEHAVIIPGAHSDLMGIWLEFHWLTEMFGQKGVAWEVVSHSNGTFENRHIDTMVIRLSSGDPVTEYFDITESFGKS